jgi:hypothetical protein
VGRTGFRDAAVERRLLALGLQLFLEAAFGVGLLRVAFHRDLGEGRFEQAQNECPRGFPARVGKDRSEDRLHRVGKD